MRWRNNLIFRILSSHHDTICCIGLCFHLCLTICSASWPDCCRKSIKCTLKTPKLLFFVLIPNHTCQSIITNHCFVQSSIITRNSKTMMISIAPPTLPAVTRHESPHDSPLPSPMFLMLSSKKVYCLFDYLERLL